LLGLDVGTTGCKSAVFDQQGRMLGASYREYPIVCQEPLQAEQDAVMVWQSLRVTMAEAIYNAQVREVRAVSLSVQGDAVMPVDRKYTPLHPVVLGMDYRPTVQCDAYAAKHDSWALYQTTGQPLHPINMLAKIMWFQDQRPSVCENTYKFITYGEFIMHRLGGEPFIDHTMASRSMGTDLLGGRWSDAVLGDMGVDKAMLSPICDSGAELGCLDAVLAKDLGLQNRPVLIAGAHDQPAAAIGAGVVQEGMALDSSGTAEVLSTTYDAPRISKKMYQSYYSCYCHAVAGQYFSFAHMQVGGILLRWYRDNLAPLEVQQAKAMGEDALAHIQQGIGPGPSPLLVLPHFNGSGTPACDVQSKGAIVGLTLSSTRQDVFKAMMDSLCYELNINIEAMEAAGIPIRALRVVGGGAKSPLWMQAKADVTGRSITTLACRESGCLGAAILAAVGVGMYPSVEQAIAAMVKTGRVYHPNARHASAYRKQYETYRLLYPGLRDINARL